jgi:lysophospholipase L1-like esterase
MLKPQSFLIALLSGGLCLSSSAATKEFALRDGDRVVFYGDSITQDGGYGRVVEEFVRSRFPKWNVRFYNAGVGGDTVLGGWAGTSGTRVVRDVIDLKPSVVTVMLGMNDGGYKELDQERLERFTAGYRTIVMTIRKALPDARIYLIRSSPFDDITRPPGFGKGYDAVLKQLGDAVTAIGADLHLEVIDFGERLDRGLSATSQDNADLAGLILPDRVHPSPGGHLVMGACLLQAWNAPALVAQVHIDAASKTVVSATNAAISDLTVQAGAISWHETDLGLPLPHNFEDSDTKLAQKAGADLELIDSEPLEITGLDSGNYQLRIDDQDVGQYSDKTLAGGVNLALCQTPMRQQAYQVRWGPDDGTAVQRVRRQMLVAASKGESGAAAAAEVLASHDEADQAKRSVLALPKEHVFTLTKAGP